jgi:hypothetical protein
MQVVVGVAHMAQAVQEQAEHRAQAAQVAAGAAAQ